jgi:outer membrane protein assembly factor BamB
MPHTLSLTALVLLASPCFAQPKAPFPYVWATAYHILPGTHTDESGYFSLCEGKNGKIYVGAAAYGFNAYLVEFDPKTGKQRIVIDVNKVCGLEQPKTPTYAAQSKIHTRNFVGPSGKIYLGSKQGYRRGKDDTADYPGGYVMVYDPDTDRSENLGMPYKGEGVIDVAADEKRGLVYVVTCEEQHWMVYDVKTKKYRELDPNLRLTPYASTLFDNRGRAHAITKDLRLATFNPDTGKLSVASIAIDQKPLGADPKFGPACWDVTADGKTAYLIRMSEAVLYRIDLSGIGAAVEAANLGKLIEGKNYDSRGSLIVGSDGKVHALIRVDNETKFGGGYLHHLVTYDPATNTPSDHGVLGVKNSDWFDFSPGQDGKPKPWTHGFHKLPDGTYTPLHAHMALIQAKDGTFYATIIYPFTLMRIEPKDVK